MPERRGRALRSALRKDWLGANWRAGGQECPPPRIPGTVSKKILHPQAGVRTFRSVNAFARHCNYHGDCREKAGARPILKGGCGQEMIRAERELRAVSKTIDKRRSQ